MILYPVHDTSRYRLFHSIAQRPTDESEDKSRTGPCLVSGPALDKSPAALVLTVLVFLLQAELLQADLAIWISIVSTVRDK